MKNVKILHKRGVRAPIPDDLVVGEVAINSLEGELYVKTDGGEVVAIGGGDKGTGGGSSVTISETAPLDASNGDEWFCSEEGQEALYIFDGEVWFGVPIGGDVVAPKEYELSTETRAGNVILSIVNDALPVNTKDGSIDWDVEGGELVGDARTGEINIPLQEKE